MNADRSTTSLYRAFSATYLHKISARKLYRLILVSFLVLPVFSANADEIAPGDNLIIEGIPKIPLALADDVARYREFRRARFLDWHPIRKEILINTRLGNTYQLHQVRFPGGARTQLTFYDDNVFAGRYQPTHGGYFIFSRDVGGDEQYQNYRYDVDTGAVTLLTDGKSRNSLGIWSRRGDRLTYTSTRRNGKDTDLYLIDPANPKTDRLLAQLDGGGWSPLDWSPDDRKIALRQFISINETYLWLVDVGGGEKTLLTPKIGPAQVAYDSAKFSKDGKGLFVITDAGSEFSRLAYLDLGTRALKSFASDLRGDVENFDLAADGTRIAFVTNEDGVGKLYLMEIPSRRIRRVSNFPVGVPGRVKWHKNGRYLGFTLSSARLPGEAFSLDLQSGKIERWTRSETGGLNTEKFVVPELVRWKSFDGKTISGFFYRPPNKFPGKRPVIIDIHGGPESQFRPWFIGNNNYYLQELGAAIIFPNIRGSAGFGKSFLRLDDGFLRADAYKDIGALLEWIQAHPYLDASRVLVTGASYGGHMSLAVSYLYSERISCSVDIVGTSNLVTFLETTADYRRDLRRAEYGDERDPKMRAFLEQTAPLTHAGEIKKPLLVIQGRNDPRVPVTEAEQMVGAIRTNGTPVWYLMAKDEGHGFAKKRNTDFQFYTTVLFMKECLLK